MAIIASDATNMSNVFAQDIRLVVRGSGYEIPRFLSLKSEEANMRVGPGNEYPILWTYKQNSFLPHISEDDQIYDNIDVPVYLSTKNENPFKAELLFSIDGFLPDNIDHFERVIIIIDVNDELLNEKYKNYYLDINKNFEDIVFYKSDDNGKWIEKNFMR